MRTPLIWLAAAVAALAVLWVFLRIIEGAQ